MNYIGMTEDEIKLEEKPVNPKTRRIWAKTGGIWRKNIESGQRVEKGDLVGRISDLTGRTKQTINAPFSGVISFLRIHYSVNEGDTLLWLTEV
jgi:predicted deacylase